ncbi:MAG: DUF2807 domain-containing protein [Prevotella sp.]|nr:DUF2807 domain-containing protein [Bacteroides sp.]MCM1366976.1 DUF2807 domain-containing protein [Prevotella sp.]MCM1437485.1 DUF2807 domain-containing protein [Prevotella sp.]
MGFLSVYASSANSDAGGVYEYAVKIGQFDRLFVQDNVNVLYKCNPDSTGYASWRGASRFDNAFIFNNKNGKLSIQVITEDAYDKDLPTIVLYSDFLTQVESSSMGSVRIESLSPTAKFKATLIGNGSLVVHGIKSTKLEGTLNTGNGSIVLSGQTNEAKYKMVGVGTIQADMVKAETVKCSILGSGTIGCWPLEVLKVSGIGSTKIYYRGNPEVHKSGGGKLMKISGEAEDDEY